MALMEMAFTRSSSPNQGGNPQLDEFPPLRKALGSGIRQGLRQFLRERTESLGDFRYVDAIF